MMTDLPHPQLPLRLSRMPNTDFENFMEEGNEQLVSRLKLTANGVQSGWLYLWGGEQSGKSHLLQAVCHLMEDSDKLVFYLSAAELLGLQPEVLSQLYDHDLVAIDDVQLLLGESKWEEALFHLFNQLRDQGKSLLISADCAPRYLPAGLADLVSRLSSMEVYQVSLLVDDAKAQLMRQGANQRGFALNDDVISYVMTRSDRNLNALQRVLEKLDHRSLQEKRLITVPFVKKVMGW